MDAGAKNNEHRIAWAPRCEAPDRSVVCKMQSTLIILMVLFFTPTLSGISSEWFDRNKELKVVFSSSSWKYIEKANYYDSKGEIEKADNYLRNAKELTEKASPFTPTNWPKDWPRDFESLKLLKYAFPDAYINRIIGDFAFSHNKNKEAIKYYQIYLSKCLIPHSDYMEKLAILFEKESLWKEALSVYHDLYKNIETNNFYGKKFILEEILRRIKNIEIGLKKPFVFVLNVSFRDIPEFLQEDFNKIFKEEISKNLKDVEFVKEEDFKKVLTENSITELELEDDNELARVGKMLNIKYVIKAILAKIKENYILQIKIFDTEKSIWFENYEYKNQDFQYLTNFVKRFTFQFQGKEIPSELYLPTNIILWSYETDTWINDLKVSIDNKRIICGCESGSVYIFSEKGELIRKFEMKDRVIKVGISPEGDYFAWACLDGNIYFANIKGVMWNKKFDNLGRALAISENGKFISVGVNNKVWYLDKKGEIFWTKEFSPWITSFTISNDATEIGIGFENGDVCVFTEEGNCKWKTNIGGKITRINFSPKGEVISVEDDKGEISVFDKKGKQIISFKAGEEKKFTFFSQEILYALIGKRGNYFYSLSPDKESLWNYQLKEKINFLESSFDGRNAVVVEGKNLFFVSIEWK